METIDFTREIKKRKGCRVSYLTVYVKHPYYGFADSDLGISFCRMNKTGEVRKDKTGKVRWYHGSNNSLAKAITSARKRYGLKFTPSGWTKVNIKAYNITEAENIVKFLND